MGLYDYFVGVEYNCKQHGQLQTILSDQPRVISITCDLILHIRGGYGKAPLEVDDSYRCHAKDNGVIAI
jgi:hypothetical protein